jgi:hydroxymethylpyrimidine pyrophosphatase-like HAD family hydrolase
MGVSKASGLEYVARELGVDASDVLAIGDGRNDVEMLRWAGRGVAMGQAVEEVREAADDVTAPVHDDGAAVELSRYWPES